MSMIDVRRAFTEGLQGKASLLSATMEYLEGGRQQRLVFSITRDGKPYSATEDIPAAANINTEAKRMAAEWLAKTEGA